MSREGSVPISLHGIGTALGLGVFVGAQVRIISHFCAVHPPEMLVLHRTALH